MTTFVFMNGKKEVTRLSEADLAKFDASMGEINHAIEVLFDQEITTIKSLDRKSVV